MELAEFIQIIKKGYKVIALCVLLGILLAVAVYFLPAKYSATGALFIGRRADESSRFFTYEGYYGQQSALSYATTISGLAETTDIIKLTLDKLGVTTDERTIRKFDRNLLVKKSAPQLVSITVKDYNPQSAKDAWQALTTTLVRTSDSINLQNDPNLKIVKISEEPVIKEAYRSLAVNIPVGMGFGFIIGLFVSALKPYFKKNKSKK